MSDALNIYANEIKSEGIARRIIYSAKQELMIAMPYLDRVLLNMPVVFYADVDEHPEAAIGFGTDGEKIIAVPSIILEMYTGSGTRINRMLFHSILHCLFNHMYAYDQLDAEIWDISADIAAESIILDLNLPSLTIEGDDVRRETLISLFTNTSKKNAESIYAYLKKNPARLKDAEKLSFLFKRDRHDLWRSGQEDEMNPDYSEQSSSAEKARRQLDQEISDYEISRGLEPGTLTKVFHLREVKRDNYDELLNRFVTSEEEMKLDLESFDYVYYTYGLRLYQNMPLIEPLEYKQDKKISDLVIAIDTSGSCEGKLVEGFLKKTYGILKNSDAFRDRMNVHIMQCDAAVQEEVMITSQADFDAYIADFTIKGMGGTDFRPVFDRIEEEKRSGAFEDLRGLIYFTDGRGTYPVYTPSFKTAMVFLKEEKDVPEVPAWAAKIMIDEEEE